MLVDGLNASLTVANLDYFPLVLRRSAILAYSADSAQKESFLNNNNSLCSQKETAIFRLGPPKILISRCKMNSRLLAWWFQKQSIRLRLVFIACNYEENKIGLTIIIAAHLDLNSSTMNKVAQKAIWLFRDKFGRVCFTEHVAIVCMDQFSII